MDGAMDREPVNYSIDGGISVITIDFPPVNAMGDRVKEGLSRVLDELSHIEGARVVILTGAGDTFFMAGANIPELLDLNPEKGKQRVLKTRELFSKIENSDKPVICAINGHALGIGLELALCCDIRIASREAKLGLPEVNLGIMPGAGGTQRLPRLIGKGKAKELILTGERVTAEQALRMGLIEKVVPKGEVLKEVMALGRVILSKAPVALKAAKRAIDRGLEGGLEEGLDLENELWAELCGTEDKEEGVRAFLEKRRPKFRGS